MICVKCTTVWMEVTNSDQLHPLTTRWSREPGCYQGLRSQNQNKFFHLLCSLLLFIVFTNTFWLKVNAEYGATQKLNCFLPFIIIRSLYNGRQYLNYKSPMEVFDAGWIHTAAEGQIKIRGFTSSCDVCYKNGNITCGSQVFNQAFLSFFVYFFFKYFSLCESSQCTDDILHLLYTNLKEGTPFREEQVYCIDWVWFKWHLA